MNLPYQAKVGFLGRLPKSTFRSLKGLDNLTEPTIPDEILYIHQRYQTTSYDLTSDVIRIGDIDEPKIAAKLQKLSPIRKGKYDLFGTYIDSEWDCSLRWNFLRSQIDFTDKTILDIGCNNGYYLLKFLSQSASYVVGVDINEKTIRQAQLLRGFLPDLPMRVISGDFLNLPEKDVNFDMISYMGVLYHARDPISHLFKISNLLKVGGELILETIVPNDGSDIFPIDTYANMPNVWWVPSVSMIERWLLRTGFVDIVLLEKREMRDGEQRRTSFADSPSYESQMSTSGETIEGLPFYDRAIIKAIKRQAKI